MKVATRSIKHTKHMTQSIKYANYNDGKKDPPGFLFSGELIHVVEKITWFLIDPG